MCNFIKNVHASRGTGSFLRVLCALYAYQYCTVAAACRLTVHRLAARTVIRSLEMQERESRGQDGAVKKQVVELSVQSGVSSASTAFIAVNQEDGKTIDGPLLRRNVPAPGKHCWPVIYYKVIQ